MQSDKITITRQELYEKVWSTPIRTLAKGFGLSDVGLAKVCRRNNIPLPGLGHWAKVQAGKKVAQSPLKQPQDNSAIKISIIEKKLEYFDENQLTDAEILLRKVRNIASSLQISTSLDSLHSIAARAWKSLRNAPKDKLKVLQPRIEQCISISVTEGSLSRALLIFDTLIKVLEQLGCSVTLPSAEKHSTIIHILGEEIPVKLKEKIIILEEGINYSRLHWHSEIKSKSTGKLTLSIDNNSYWMQGIRRQWGDGESQRLENCICSIVTGLINFALKMRSNRIEEEVRRKRWEEEENRRKEQERLKKEQQQRIEQIEQQVSAWRKAEAIRDYLTVIKNTTLKKCGRIDDGSEMDLWLKWGLAYADHIDPVLKMT